MTHAQVTIQITPKSVPSTPSWMGEVAAFAQVLTHTEILTKIQEQVRFARAHFGQEFAQIFAQWVWNLRLELGHQLVPAELRTTEFASVHESEAFSTDKPLPVEAPAPGVTYGPPQ